MAGWAGAPSSRSGATYAGVPKVPPSSSSSGAPTRVAMPKSSTLAPTRVIITFDGVMSRCTMPSRCAAATASATCAPVSTAAGQGSGPSVSRCSSSSPLSSSITTNEVIEPSGATVSP
ncbi:hypothetical protein B0E53_06598 [Micromonospora sp. MH33]|nr:hypothetical protein B0E53_06598 [Micromonospora sp. MH33]